MLLLINLMTRWMLCSLEARTDGRSIRRLWQRTEADLLGMRLFRHRYHVNGWLWRRPLSHDAWPSVHDLLHVRCPGQSTRPFSVSSIRPTLYYKPIVCSIIPSNSPLYKGSLF